MVCPTCWRIAPTSNPIRCVALESSLNQLRNAFRRRLDQLSDGWTTLPPWKPSQRAELPVARSGNQLRNSSRTSCLNSPTSALRQASGECGHYLASLCRARLWQLDFTDCPLDFSELDVNHLAFCPLVGYHIRLPCVVTECIAYVKPFDQLATDLAAGTVAQYNFITPNLCHDGHEGVSPCDPSESSDNTMRGDTWLSTEVPKILYSQVHGWGLVHHLG